jgi:hypothetical protein
MENNNGIYLVNTMICKHLTKTWKTVGGNTVRDNHPCGKCMPCRITKRQEWTCRILLEMREHEFNYFVNPTYRDDQLEWTNDVGPTQLPPKTTISKKTLQNYIKRLRKNLDHKIRYYAVGEYGDKKQRPHYHLFIFSNTEIPIQNELKFNRVKRRYEEHTTSSPFLTAWLPDARCDCVAIPSLEDGTKVARYIAGYTLKKLSDKSREPDDRTPEFQIMSRNKGIGLTGLNRLAQALIKKGIGSIGTNADHITGLYMIRLNGKKWPIGRYMRDQLIEMLGGDQRSDLVKALSKNQKILDKISEPDYIENSEAEEAEDMHQVNQILKQHTRGRTYG